MFVGGTATLAPPPPFAPQYTFLPSPLLGRPPPPPPFYPQILYWPYPSPPVSPPQPPSTVILMHDPANLLHSVPDWGVDYLAPGHQLTTQNIGTMGMHSAAA
ncbi:hypothetical protein J6590_035225 [Homalodisca vitripennis]|nr:hypothetical protein J6590_035225 [Homalodisca vitripennis]